MTKWQLEAEALLVEEIPQEATVIQMVGEATQEVPLEITILTVVGIQDNQDRTALAKEDMAALAKTLHTVGDMATLAKMIHTVEDMVALAKMIHTVEDMATLAKMVYTVGEIPTMTKHDNAMDMDTECQALAK